MEKIKILICCEAEKQQQYQNKASEIYGEMIEIVGSLEDEPNRVFMIYPVLEQEIKKAAKERKIPVFYLTEDFIPMQLYESLLRDE